MWWACLYWVFLGFILTWIEYEWTWFITFAAGILHWSLCYSCLASIRCSNQFELFKFIFHVVSNHMFVLLWPLCLMCFQALVKLLLYYVLVVIWVSSIWDLYVQLNLCLSTLEMIYFSFGVNEYVSCTVLFWVNVICDFGSLLYRFVASSFQLVI